MKKKEINPAYLNEVRRIIGGWLKEMRESKGLTMKELAEMMGIHEATVSKIENGKWSVSLDMLVLFSINLNFFPFFVEKDSNDELAEMMRSRWKRSHNDN